MKQGFNRWGWYVGPVADDEPLSTTEAPANTSTADAAGALRANWSGSAWLDLPYAAPPPPPAQTSVVPSSVSAAQALIALSRRGIAETDIDQLVEQLPAGQQRNEARIWWRRAATFERNHPVLQVLAAALELSETDLDDLFTEGATL